MAINADYIGSNRLLIGLVIVSTVSWFVRYRFLNMYTRLPPEPQRKEPQIDLFPDVQEGDSKPGLANYLDEFLSAIKVFGYLERPVFHELTRTMQTRKLIAGETLLLEEEKGFCLVVDGLVQIFVKSMRDQEESRPQSSMYGDATLEDDEDSPQDGSQRYQLLTEVKNGASMSSLFSILSLFTEDLRLRYDDERSPRSSFASVHTPDFGAAQTPPPATPPSRGMHHERRLSHEVKGPGRGSLPSVPPLTLEPDPMDGDRGRRRPRIRPGLNRTATSVHPDIVARAVVDTTIAVIPASAFRRLTRVYPKATAHIVQVILTRLHRVTLSTAHSYLGLTSEVLRIERLMNKYTTYDLPNHLRGHALDRLKDKFLKERERLGPSDVAKGIALHNPSAGRRRRSSSSLRKEATIHSRSFTAKSGLNGLTPSGALTGPSHTSPGDLLSTLHMSRAQNQNRQDHPTMHRLPTQNSVVRSNKPSTDAKTPLSQVENKPFRPSGTTPLLQRQESVDEDSVFREQILQCMVKAIGLTADSAEAFRGVPKSAEQSPRLLSYDSRRQKAVFSNAFGFIDPYEASADGDTESTVSMSVASTSAASGYNIIEELRDDIEIVFFPKDSVLVEQGERNPGLYYVIDGFLDVSIPGDDKDDAKMMERDGHSGRSSNELFAPLQKSNSGASRTSMPGADPRKKKAQSGKSLFLIKPGGIAGYIGTVSSQRSFTDVTAKTDVYVGFLPRASLERLTDKYPVVLLTMAKRLTNLLPRLILHIDFALEWVQVNAGQVIHHQGDDSDSIYIVLNGRLRAVWEKADGDMRLLGEYGQGESVGELEVMTDSTRPATLHAIRDTEMAKFPRSLFNSLAQEHPGITIQISKLIAQRMRALIEDPVLEKGSEKGSAVSQQAVSSSLNLRTVTILPVTAGVPVVEFGNRLLNALNQVGTPNGATSLNQAAILNHLGRHAFSKMGKLKLSQYLADLEEKYGMVLYIADTNVNAPWTQTCIKQADCILLVGLAEGSPAIGEYERFLLGMKTTARKELVLLHSERYAIPGLTRRWLNNRMWINGGHHHIQMAFRLTPEPAHPQVKRFGSALKQRVQVLQAEIQKYTGRKVSTTPIYSPETPFKSDFHRLARRLCGKSVGLVLGGGGARGISQIGIIKAMEEAGIPIDIVGGTSIGSFIGALYAQDADVVPMYGRAKRFAGRMASMWRFALDLTYPTVSYTTGHEFNRGIFKTFGQSQIEDFWLEYYCNTTNISKSRNEIHTSGYVWRYVRASMSLAGLIPPFCDEGNMLLDGGYIDNLTVAHMQSLGADLIFAIDVGSLDDDTPQAFGDSLSGFWAAMNRWNPFSSYPNPPTLAEIQSRLAYVSSIDALERAKAMNGVVYMRPPIDPYGTLDFAKFEEIYKVGYDFGKEFVEKLVREEREVGQVRDGAKGKGTGVGGNVKGSAGVGRLGMLLGGYGMGGMGEEEKRRLRRTMAPRRASI